MLPLQKEKMKQDASKTALYELWSALLDTRSSQAETDFWSPVIHFTSLFYSKENKAQKEEMKKEEWWWLELTLQADRPGFNN